MNDFIATIFSSDGFMPHGHCYLWRLDLLWLHLISDTLIALAYYSIPITLIYFVRKRKDLEFDWIFVCFAVFILACGTTHLMEIWTIWHPTYWLSGVIKAFTALVSIPTAFLLLRLVPLALAMPSPSALKALNEQMRNEITERKRAEFALSQKYIELDTLNKELEAFSYSVSHDLRAPLRSMDGFSLALLEDYEDTLDAEGKDALNRIRAASQRMGRLIDDMLRLSQVTRAQIKPEEVNLSRLATEVTHSLLAEQPTRPIELIIEDGMTIKADKALIQIVMQNLLENAWKFTSKTNKPIVRIGTVDRNGDKAYFITDNGAGFDMKHADKLFGAFQRLHQTTDFPGTGIGLAIIQRIINRHHGEIWVEAQEGVGATFFFTVRGLINDAHGENNPSG